MHQKFTIEKEVYGRECGMEQRIWHLVMHVEFTGHHQILLYWHSPHNFFCSVVDTTPSDIYTFIAAEEYSAEKLDDPLMQIARLQEFDGSFRLNERWSQSHEPIWSIPILEFIWDSETGFNAMLSEVNPNAGTEEHCNQNICLSPIPTGQAYASEVYCDEACQNVWATQRK